MSKKNSEKANEKVVELVRKEEVAPAAESAPVEKPARILPVRVTDNDRFKVLLAGEKVKRAQAELQLLAVKLNAQDADVKKLDAEEKNTLREVWARYELGPEDTFDSETGMITRKAPPPDGSTPAR